MGKTMESVGLAGAQVMGEKKVSSLLQFSWTAQRDRAGAPTEASTSKRKQKRGHAKPPVRAKGHRKEG
jgi:hypothetical protein